MYASLSWGKLSKAWQHCLHVKKTSQRHSFWPYLCERSKMADKALSTSCYCDEEAHHITNKLSFEEEDPSQ